MEKVAPERQRRGREGRGVLEDVQPQTYPASSKIFLHFSLPKENAELLSGVCIERGLHVVSETNIGTVSWAPLVRGWGGTSTERRGGAHLGFLER